MDETTAPDPVEPTTDTPLADALTAATTPEPPQEVSAEATPSTPSWARTLMLLALLVLAGQVLTAVLVQQRSAQLSEEIAASRSLSEEGLDAVDARVDRLGSIIGGLSLQIEQLEAEGASTGASPVDEQQTVQTGLPPIPQGGADPALGMTLGPFTGIDWTTGAEHTVEASDKAKVIMIWAHWCPYCQHELPILQEMASLGELDQFDAVELISVTTFIDESRPNPLEPYLEDSQFSFPVLVDPDRSIANSLGVQAVPAWVILDGNGTVLGRFTGAIPEEQIIGIFTEVQKLQTES